MGKEPGKMRQPNIELLRVLAMLMIITLHYMDKGDVLAVFAESHGLNQRLAWGIEILSLVSVNIYVLISGYFLVESKFRFKKVILIWAQVLFYSYIIGGIFFALNLVPADQKGFYDLIFIAAPISASHYWFATVYLLLFLVFPFLNAGIAHMNRKQHKAALIVLLVVLSLWKSFLPFTVPRTDNAGMDLLWFVFLYLIAAYIRKYPECIKAKGYVYLLGYIGSTAVTYLAGIALLFIGEKVGKLGGFATNLFSYNSVTMLIGAVCLFVFFLKWDMKLPKWMAKFIVLLGSCTFGVFLIHEHYYMRYYWPKLFKVAEHADKPYMVLHWIGTVAAVFAICSVIELVRQLLFGLITKRKFFQKLMDLFKPIEDKMNGDAN